MLSRILIVSNLAHHCFSFDEIDGDREHRKNQLLHPGSTQVFPQHGLELVSSVFVEQIPIAAARQLSKEPGWLQIGLEDMRNILGI